MADEIRAGQIGLSLRTTVKSGGTAQDVSGATTKELRLTRPDGTSVDKSAAFGSDGTDGIIEYVTQAADITTVGRYKIQAYIVTPADTYRCFPHEFDVRGNLPAP